MKGFSTTRISTRLKNNLQKSRLTLAEVRATKRTDSIRKTRITTTTTITYWGTTICGWKQEDQIRRRNIPSLRKRRLDDFTLKKKTTMTTANPAIAMRLRMSLLMKTRTKATTAVRNKTPVGLNTLGKCTGNTLLLLASPVLPIRVRNFLTDPLSKSLEWLPC